MQVHEWVDFFQRKGAKTPRCAEKILAILGVLALRFPGMGSFYD
jgi:hypothetical protein